MAIDRDYEVRNGRGAFGGSPVSQQPAQKKVASSAPGMNLRGGVAGGGGISTRMRPARPGLAPRMRQNRRPTGPVPGAGMAPVGMQGARFNLTPTGAPPTGAPPTATGAPPTGQDPYAVNNAGGAFGGSFPQDQSAPNSLLATQVSPGVYRDGNSYGDTARGAFTGPSGGNFIQSTTGQGAFGRNPAEQTAIENRVAEINRARETIRGLRDIPTELDRMKSQANQRVSLNQGIGGFVNAGAQRRYAQGRVKDLEKGALDQAKLAQEASQQGFENALASMNAQKGAFKTTTITGPDGVEVPLTTNTATGETSLGEAPQRQLTPDQWRSEFTRMADEAWSKEGGLFTSEGDVFQDGQGKPLSREEWVEMKVQEATSQGQQESGIAPETLTPENLEYTAKKRGMTVEQVKAQLGVR